MFDLSVVLTSAPPRVASDSNHHRSEEEQNDRSSCPRCSQFANADIPIANRFDLATGMYSIAPVPAAYVVLSVALVANALKMDLGAILYNVGSSTLSRQDEHGTPSQG